MMKKAVGIAFMHFMVVMAGFVLALLGLCQIDGSCFMESLTSPIYLCACFATAACAAESAYRNEKAMALQKAAVTVN